MNMNTAQAISGQINEHCVAYKSIVMQSGSDNRGEKFEVEEDDQAEDEKMIVAGEGREDTRAGEDTASKVGLNKTIKKVPL